MIWPGAVLSELGRDDGPGSEILAIGDGAHTDIDGAMGEDIDSLFISGGLAARPRPKRRTNRILKR